LDSVWWFLKQGMKLFWGYGVHGIMGYRRYFEGTQLVFW
jgi:hypothetical protein